MKNIYILSFFLFTSQIVSAQLLAPYTLYRDHWNVINPASVSSNYTINEYNFSVGISDRHQWITEGVNFDVSPNTQIINFEWISEYNNIVLGGHVSKDRLGALSSTAAYAHFAYLFPLDYKKYHRISAGLAAGFVQDHSAINGNDQKYFLIPENDIIPSSSWRPDFNFGIYYYYRDVLYAGLSAPQILGLTTQFGNTDEYTFAVNRPRHFYGVVGGYIPFDFFGLGDESSFLELSTWARYTPFREKGSKFRSHRFRIDGNARYMHNQIFWLGFGVGLSLPPFSTQAYTENQTFWPMIGHVEAGFLAGEALDLFESQLKIGMALDFQVAGELRHLGPSAELTLSYSWY